MVDVGTQFFYEKWGGILTTDLLLIIFNSEQMCILLKKDGVYELVCCQMFERICILGPKGNGL